MRSDAAASAVARFAAASSKIRAVHPLISIGGNSVVDHPSGERVELAARRRVGGRERDRTARVSAGGDFGFDRDRGHERRADLGRERGTTALAEERVPLARPA